MLSWVKGKMNAATQAIHMAPLYYRNLQGCLREARQESALPYINKRGETISPTELPSQRAVAVVHEEEQPLESPAPTGCTQHCSRVMKDRSDWKLNPIIFQQINQRLGPLEVD